MGHLKETPDGHGADAWANGLLNLPDVCFHHPNLLGEEVAGQGVRSLGMFAYKPMAHPSPSGVGEELMARYPNRWVGEAKLVWGSVALAMMVHPHLNHWGVGAISAGPLMVSLYQSCLSVS